MQKVRDIMSKKLITVRPETPVKEIIRVLIVNSVSSTPVVDPEMNLLGLVTAETLIARGRAHREGLFKAEIHLDPHSFVQEQKKLYGSAAKDIMIKHVVTASENMDIYELVTLMEDTKASRIPIVRGTKVVGFVSRHDLLKAILVFEEEREEEEEPLSDEEISRLVLEGLKKNLGISLMNIRITTRRGVVHLQGQVSSLQDIQAAGEIAGSLPGVKSVENGLLVDRMLD